MSEQLRLKLLRTAAFQDEKLRCFGHIFFPPLAMGVIFSKLKKAGYSVSQDDLSIRMHHKIFSGAQDQPAYGLFFQKSRVAGYLETGDDPEIESFIVDSVSQVELDGTDIFLLSLPETLTNPSNIFFALAFSKWLKKKFSSPVILGGHPFGMVMLVQNFNPDGVIDCVVCEDGEEAVIEAIQAVVSRKADGQKTLFLRKPSNEILFPDFEGLPVSKYNFDFPVARKMLEHSHFKESLTSNMLLLPVQFIKGCSSRCAFCGSSAKGLRSYLKPEEVVWHIGQLQKRYNPLGYFFLHDTLNFTSDYFNKLCGLMIESRQKILWSDCARANGFDESAAVKAREAGCIRLIFGLETASQGILNQVNKGISLTEVQCALRAADANGIWTGVEIICGLPHETDKDIEDTINFLSQNKQYIDRIYCNVFDLRDNSLMYLQPQHYGIENIEDINLYSSSSPDDFNQSNFVRFKFDEIGGLKWEDKKKQMLDSYKRVISSVDTGQRYEGSLEEHLLFYCYSKYQDKKEVRNYFSRGL